LIPLLLLFTEEVSKWTEVLNSTWAKRKRSKKDNDAEKVLKKDEEEQGDVHEPQDNVSD